MGWLGDQIGKILSKIASAPPVEFTFARSIQAEAVPDVSGELQADGCYVELYLESLRIESARRFTARFNAVVYSAVSVARDGSPAAQLIAVSKPKMLTDLDESAIGRVITISKRLMAATPYRGGPIALELGLFSVKSGDLLGPLLSYVGRVSEIAGISYVGAVRPFIPLMIEGMELLANQGKDSVLEVGADVDIKPTNGAVMAIVAKPPSIIDASKLRLQEDGRLFHDGRALECSYATFSLRVSSQKPDFAEIPELRESYARMKEEVVRGDEVEARAAFAAFRLCAIASPDLIPSDAKRLVSKARAQLEEAFEPQASLSSSRDIADLVSLKLYDNAP